MAERGSGSAGALVYCKEVFLTKAWDRGGTGGNEDFPRAGHLPMDPNPDPCGPRICALNSTHPSPPGKTDGLVSLWIVFLSFLLKVFSGAEKEERNARPALSFRSTLRRGGAMGINTASSVSLEQAGSLRGPSPADDKAIHKHKTCRGESIESRGPC